MFAIPASSRIEPKPLSRLPDNRGVEAGPESGLGGALPAPIAGPNFVSFENMSQLAQLPDRKVSGFLLLDTRAGEIHLLGKLSGPASHGPSELVLQIVTASENVQYSLSFDSSGLCKALVPLPREPILKIEIVSPPTSNADASRPTNSRQVD